MIRPRIIGKNRNVLKFQVEDRGGNRMEAVYFGNVNTCLEEMEKGGEMSFTYYPSVNEYMGRRTLQITVVNYRR